MVPKSAMVPATELRSFRQLRAWQEAMDLTVSIHEAAREIPQEHRFELAREIRRSAISIPSNIAEGFSRHSRRLYRWHVANALGSNAELATQLEAGKRHGLDFSSSLGWTSYSCKLTIWRGCSRDSGGASVSPEYYES
jgi:four helix bundle protein